MTGTLGHAVRRGVFGPVAEVGLFIDKKGEYIENRMEIRTASVIFDLQNPGRLFDRTAHAAQASGHNGSGSESYGSHRPSACMHASSALKREERGGRIGRFLIRF